LKNEGFLKVLDLTKVEEAKFETPIEVLVTTLCRIGVNLMSRPASPTRDDEEFFLHLKPFIGMAMPTEK
jgi:hypothetical protein